MQEYYFKNDEFVIESYDKQRTFTSFLPAIAGIKGIPLWTYYVNRGQIMSSFGVKDKNGAILEFFPAYSAYQVVNRIGFRTFVKENNKVYEFFSDIVKTNAKRIMKIKRAEVSIEEINKSLNLKVEVTYFTLPNENIASLVRKVKITNLSSKPRNLELLDGISQVFPPNTDHGVYKVMSNLQRSWMEVIGLEKTSSAYYKMIASNSDSAEVNEVKEGNFYLSMVNGKIVKPLVDPEVIFGTDTSYILAENFKHKSLDEIVNGPSYPYNKALCGFTPVKVCLKANEQIRIDTLIGRMHSFEAYQNIINKIADVDFIDRKQVENIKIIDDMTKDVKTDTSNKLFNEYIESTFLDNMLRGGYPFNFKDANGKDNIYYLFSRKHGDPERDYNWFNIENEFYSQGNGNFRDICQNRRSDSMLNEKVKDYNLKYFMNLVQLDGYNPLGVNGVSYSLKDGVDVKKVVSQNFKDHNQIMEKLLASKFTPGAIVNTQINNKIEALVDENTYLANILAVSKLEVEASFNEGYWCDHFTYILDLYDSYKAVYPDGLENTLFADKTYKFFESPCYVAARKEKTVITKSGKIRQYGSLIEHDNVKIETFNLNPYGTNYAKFKNQETIYTNLASKFLMLAFLKFNLLDNQGIGIEMEGGKPGWNDACNGLPGLFGSSVGETVETYRIVLMLKEIASKYGQNKLYLPSEFLAFFKANMKLLKENLSDFDYYDKSSDLREAYRTQLRTGLTKNEEVTLASLKVALGAMERKLRNAISKAIKLGNGIIPTFLTYEVDKYEKVVDENGNPCLGYKGYQLVKPLSYKYQSLPYFLEGPARLMKCYEDKKYLKQLFANVKASDIYDHQLKMYKTSEQLENATFEIGRIHAFNKGWLERESNFMHMTYKYLYGLLKAKMYKEFYQEIKTNMVCNMNPKVYGRSTLEHSSFIATSNSPDKKVHGQGFVSRLSGSTAEMLSIYLLMMTGGKIFEMKNNELTLALKPLLKKEMFKEDNTLSFTLLAKTKVTYVNPLRKDTFNLKVKKYLLDDGKQVKELAEVSGKEAMLVREGNYKEITIYLG